MVFFTCFKINTALYFFLKYKSQTVPGYLNKIVTLVYITIHNLSLYFSDPWTRGTVPLRKSPLKEWRKGVLVSEWCNAQVIHKECSGGGCTGKRQEALWWKVIVSNECFPDIWCPQWIACAVSCLPQTHPSWGWISSSPSRTLAPVGQWRR